MFSGLKEQTMSETRRLAMSHVPESTEAPFPEAEYARRLNELRQAMDALDIDLVYLTSPESLYYLTGYRAIWYQTLSLTGWEPVSGVAVHRDADALMHIECDREQAVINLTTVPHDVRIWPIGEGDFVEFVIRQLEQAGWLGARTALELSHYRPYPAASQRLVEALRSKGCTVEDGTAVINGVRSRKSSLERECVRRAAEICDVGMRAAIEHVQPGITELELFGEIVRAMSKAGGEIPSITMPVQSGHRTVACHAPPSRRRIQRGDVLNIDICGVYNRYHSDNARTFFLGEPPPHIARLVEASAAAFSILGDAARPGALWNDVLPPLEDHYRAAGIWGSQRWTGGYELGASFPPDWVGSFAYTVGEDAGEARLEPGMVVNYESNFYFSDPYGMSMLIDTLLVDETDASFIHDIPHGLIVVA